jgi:hypothetical protein
MSFNPLDYPLALSDPAYLTESSIWVGHIPFAWALLEMTRPDVFVELGTYKGDSYCAICQGVTMLKLPTRCFAVDTWAGGHGIGGYTDAILRDLRAYHDPTYGEFSLLLQTDFDSAAPHFEDGSVDLLHIDGQHTYEAVQHDYQTWKPKMSDRGVILFHDIAAGRSDFGVWKLWEELKMQFPHVDFAHSSGLGVLGVGANLPTAAQALFEIAGEDRARLQRYFEVVGGRIDMGRMLMYRNIAARRAGEVVAQWRRETGRHEHPPLSDDNMVTSVSRLARDAVELVEENRRLRAVGGMPSSSPPPATPSPPPSPQRVDPPGS